MDLVSSIRKSGSRGGVNFSWDEVASSTHRENYLGHSLKAPVGRWQKGRDLEWYAKNDAAGDGPSDETEEERAARGRREEIKRIKEAEEDALARALGLPVAPRNQTGANAVEVTKGRAGPEESVMEIPKDITEGGIGATAEIERGGATGHQGGGSTQIAKGRERIGAIENDEEITVETVAPDHQGSGMKLIRIGGKMTGTREGAIANKVKVKVKDEAAKQKS